MTDFVQETGEGQNCVMPSVRVGRSLSLMTWTYVGGLNFVKKESVDDVMNGE